MNEDYFDYLTKRLDLGVAGNLFISKATEVIYEALIHNNIVKVLDLGCFSGALLNNILSHLSITQRNRVRAVGVDVNITAMKRGSIKYKDIIFLHGDLIKSLPIVNRYDVVLLSNTLHELASRLEESIIEEIRSVIRHICNLLNPGGRIVFLDGVRVENNKKILVNFHSKGLEKLKLLAKEYKAKHIVFAKTDEFIEMELNDLAIFLTKERYLETKYWAIETEELYQTFSRSELIEIFRACQMEVLFEEVQYFKDEYLNSHIENFLSDNEPIPKNIVIVGEKHYE